MTKQCRRSCRRFSFYSTHARAFFSSQSDKWSVFSCHKSVPHGLFFTAFTRLRQQDLMSSVEDAMGDRIRLFDLLARRCYAEVTMAGVWADLLWCGASICIRYTKFYQKQTNLEIVEISYLWLVCVRVRQRAVDCDVRCACASFPDASRIRHCVTCWGLGRRGR
jgi:hypothetical protein